MNETNEIIVERGNVRARYMGDDRTEGSFFLTSKRDAIPSPIQFNRWDLDNLIHVLSSIRRAMDDR